MASKKIQIGTSTTNIGNANYGWLCVEDHGILPSNTASQNSIAINSLMTVVMNQGKGILFGAGRFFFNTIVYEPRVPLKGTGWRQTILQSVSAVSLIQSTDTVMDLPSASISH